MMNSEPEQKRKVLPIYRRLYFKIAAAFIVVFFIGTALQVILATRGWRQLAEELDQQSYWDSAQELAEQIQPLVREQISYEKLGEKFLEIQTLNPKIELFLLNAKGQLVYHLADPNIDVLEQFDLAPITQALEALSPALPLYGTDPHEKGKQQIFAVGKLTVRNEIGYLYLSLRGSMYDYLIRITGQFYVLRTILSGILLSLCISLLVGIILLRFFTRYLTTLTNAVERFGIGEIGVRAPITSTDELGQLAKAFNSMADTIVDRTEQLHKTDQLRRLFVAHVTHDLRTPLTVMRGFVELLVHPKKELRTEERNKYLTLLEQGIQSSTALVDDLFELSKLEAEERKPVLEPVAIGELLSGVVASFEPFAKSKQVTLILDVLECRHMVVADALLLQRVANNLISNSLKYTPANGTVTVSAHEKEDKIRIAVRDTGFGIPQAVQNEITESFYRVEGHQNIAEGTGLGLAIVKKILSLHNTEIEIQSEERRGSCFSFALPKFIIKAESK